MSLLCAAHLPQLGFLDLGESEMLLIEKVLGVSTTAEQERKQVYLTCSAIARQSSTLMGYCCAG